MKILYDAPSISSRIASIAESINREMAGHKQVHVIITMNGSFMFASDLCRQMSTEQILYFTGGSYFKNSIKQEIGLNPETLPGSFNHEPVLIIEDILDTGKSIKQLRQLVAERQAGPITVATLFKRMGSTAQADHCAFNIPRELFVVGYGLDMDGHHRNLKEIYTFENTVMSGVSGLC